MLVVFPITLMQYRLTLYYYFRKTSQKPSQIPSQISSQTPSDIPSWKPSQKHIVIILYKQMTNFPSKQTCLLSDNILTIISYLIKHLLSNIIIIIPFTNTQFAKSLYTVVEASPTLIIILVQSLRLNPLTTTSVVTRRSC